MLDEFVIVDLMGVVLSRYYDIAHHGSCMTCKMRIESGLYYLTSFSSPLLMYLPGQGLLTIALLVFMSFQVEFPCTLNHNS